jgi:predicted small lipoprotein YifL
MKANATLLLFLALASLAGCGQKGPLVRPGTHPPTKAAGAPAGAAAAPDAATPPASAAASAAQ